MSILLPAGTENSVVCFHWCVVGSWMKYDTQSGWELTVFCASSCMTTLTVAPVFGSHAGSEVHSVRSGQEVMHH